MNDFEYCTNGVFKLMLLLEGLPIIIGLYIFYIMSFEWTNGDALILCSDSNYILMYIVSSSNLFSFLFIYQLYYKTAAILGFSFNSYFSGKIHRERGWRDQWLRWRAVSKDRFSRDRVAKVYLIINTVMNTFILFKLVCVYITNKYIYW